ncbi:MAG: SDR family oxidoreductase [Planctomycetota bacterium]
MRLDGARILLTGASRGIGAGLVPVLHAAGAKLVIVARDAAALERVAAPHGAAVRAVPGDVTDGATPQAAVAEAEAAWGGVDCLINNAAILPEVRDLAEMPLAEFRQVLDVNVVGTVACMQAVWPGMAAREAGYIVNLSSGWGRHADAGVSSYCASKFAVEAVSRSAAAEARGTMCVAAVSPGTVYTDMLVTAFGDATASASVSPEEFAPRFAAFLAELEPSHNGGSLSVTG